MCPTGTTLLLQAILSKQRAETLSSVLYPDDRTYEGKELRLKQQHFFVSATVQDVLRRYKEAHPEGWDAFPEKVAFQMNDTHPTLLVPELMRLLMDQENLGWTKAWELVTNTCNFTNHTVLPEALERWPVAMMEKLLPRHMQIVYDINWRYLQQVGAVTLPCGQCQGWGGMRNLRRPVWQGSEVCQFTQAYLAGLPAGLCLRACLASI